MTEALECLEDFKGKFPEQAQSSACDALDKDIKAALFSKTESGMKEESNTQTTLPPPFCLRGLTKYTLLEE